MDKQQRIEKLEARIALLEQMGRNDLLATAREELAALSGNSVSPPPARSAPTIVYTRHSSLEDFALYLQQNNRRIIGKIQWRPDPKNPNRRHPFVEVG